jgi:outer membrane protein insertion porin family
MKLNKHLFITLLFVCFYLTTAFAEDLKKSDIKISGNVAISKETILNLIETDKEILKSDDLNSMQKKLFETNFFSKVDIKIEGNQVSIYLIENPIIEYVLITGLEERQDYLVNIEKKISLKANSIFSESLLNKDIKSINEFLSSAGYSQSNVEYKINKITNNKVNVFLDIKLNQQFHVREIFFLGDKVFSSSTLKSVISTTQKSWLSLFNTTAIPSVNRINYDISSLKSFYLSRGYYDVQVVNGSIDYIDQNLVNIVFVVNAGGKFFFQKPSVINSALSPKDRDLLFVNNEIKELYSKSYDPAILNKVLKNINTYFLDRNITANAEYRLKKESPNELSIVFEISEITEKKFINNIYVKGNDITEEKVVRNSLLFAEGDLYSVSNVNKSLDTLKSLEIFKNINITNEDIKNSKNINITVSLEEMATGEIAAGAGYGSSGGLVSFILKERNLFGQGIGSNISLNIGTQKVLGNISLSNPDFSGTGNTLRTSLFASQYFYDNAGYENKVYGGNVSTAYEMFKDITFESGFGADYDSIDSKSASSDLIKSRDGNYKTTKVFYNFYNDKRDRKFNPTSGYTFGFGQGLATFVSDIPYISNNAFGSFYNGFSEDFIGTIKYKIKSINSINDKDVKLSDRIFLSDNELRGFGYREVGPKLNSEFIGGNYSYSTSFSTTVPNGLPDKWGTTSNLFFDVANVWGTDFDGIADSDTIRSSVGVGFSWVSPMGPLSFTFTEAISKNSTDALQSFSFKLGSTF